MPGCTETEFKRKGKRKEVGLQKPAAHLQCIAHVKARKGKKKGGTRPKTTLLGLGHRRSSKKNGKFVAFSKAYYFYFCVAKLVF